MRRAAGEAWRGEKGGGSEEGVDGEMEQEGPRDAGETRGAEAGLPTAGWGGMGWGETCGDGAATHRARQAAAKGCVSGRSAWR